MSEQRLIDANAFDNRVRVAGGFAEEELSDDFKDGVLAVLEMLKRQPTIEERKTGKWVGIKEYCDHLNEEAEREGNGNRYIPSGMNTHVYCNQCWEPNDRRTTYCPNCSARIVQEGEDNE